jgi:signal transduction histidine kinase
MSRVQKLLGTRRFRVALPWLVCFTTFMLAALGYSAIRQSQHRARLLLERRSAELLSLLWAGIGQDMRGAQTTVLTPVTTSQLLLEPPYELAEIFARGFARFPYPESFFAWTDTPVGGTTHVFGRSERPAPWQPPDEIAGPYPAQVVDDPPVMRPVVALARSLAEDDRADVCFETSLNGIPYQVVARPLFRDDDRDPSGARLLGVVGFTVNLDWVRRSYFQELLLQIAQIGGDRDDVLLTVLDEQSQIVAASHPSRRDIMPSDRPFALLFADPALLRSTTSHQARFWTARAASASDSALAASVSGTSVMFLSLSLAAVVGVLGLLATARGVRVASELAAMKSDFVSSVTHELKTPLAGIQLIADTLSTGRYESHDTVRHYAQLISHESHRFNRLIDNLLAYAHLSDAGQGFSFEPAHVADLVDDALQPFRTVLLEREFAVSLAIPDDLPPVWIDRAAMHQVLSNVLDNAIKYSEVTRALDIRAQVDGGWVVVSVTDQGAGIADDELSRVCDKFFRGRNVKVAGNGLGLAIARRVMEAHGGVLRINSRLGWGTRIDMALTVAAS